MILPHELEELINEYTGTVFRVRGGKLQFSFMQSLLNKKHAIELKIVSGLWSCATIFRTPVFDGCLYDLVLYRVGSSYTIPTFPIYEYYNRWWNDLTLFDNCSLINYLPELHCSNKNIYYDIDNMHIDPQGHFVVIPMTAIDFKVEIYSRKAGDYVQKEIGRITKEYKAPIEVSFDTNMGILCFFTPQRSTDYYSDSEGKFIGEINFSVTGVEIQGKEDVIVEGKNNRESYSRMGINIEEGTEALRALYPYMRMLQTTITGNYIDDIACIWIRHLYQEIIKDERITNGANYKIINEREYRIVE